MSPPAERPRKESPEAGTFDLGDALSHLEGLQSESDTPEESTAAAEPPRSMREWFRLAREATSILELHPLLEALLEKFVAITAADRGFIMLDTKERNLEVSLNLEASELEGNQIAVSQTILDEVAENGRTLIVPETIGQSVYGDRSSILALKIRSFCCVPMLLGGQVVGLCYTDSTKPGKALSVDEVGILEAFADQAAVAIVNARKHEALKGEKERLENENRSLRHEVQKRHRFGSILGKSESMQKLFDLLEKFSRSNSSALIIGETGTGKELIAKALHYNGPRAQKPFLAVNCSSTPESLFESAFFGHKRGSFTGAIRDEPGHFRAADGGTIFLDEIGELPLSVQSKLLRALQEGEVTPVGETQPRRFDVRVIAATHRDLEAMVREKSFRLDLMYRLKVLQINVPPLRQRDNDVLVLAEAFIARDAERENKKNMGLHPEAARALAAYDWPGNIRELENCVNFAVTVCDNGGVIRVEHLPQAVVASFEERRGGGEPETTLGDHDASEARTAPGLAGGDGGLRPQESLKAALARSEAGFVRQALEDSGSVVSRAASRLGVSRQHLHNLIKKHRLRD